MKISLLINMKMPIENGQVMGSSGGPTWNSLPLSTIKSNTVDSRYLEIQGTMKYFEVSVP